MASGSVDELGRTKAANRFYVIVMGVMASALVTGIAAWMSFGGGVSKDDLKTTMTAQDLRWTQALAAAETRWQESMAAHASIRLHDGAVSSQEFNLVRADLANLREDMRAQAAKIDQIILLIGNGKSGG